jgi:hypothetical protein
MWGRLVPAIVAVAVALACGCATKPAPEIVEAEGVVLLNGKPLAKAEVCFVPKDQGSEYIAKGVTDDKGRFTLTCNGVAGACAGENYVTVKEGEIPAKLLGESTEAQAQLRMYQNGLGNRPIPGKYGNVAESPLRATVAAGQKEYQFQLKRSE